jgi:hypothetical protein
VVLSHVDFAYLDCGATAPEHAEYDAPWGGYWCPLVEWFQILDYIPQFLHAANEAVAKGTTPAFDSAHIKGAEVTAWGETIGESNLAEKLWPRAAALAEGLWTNRSTGSAEEAHYGSWYGSGNGTTADRLVYHNYRMAKRGVKVSVMQPRWCLLNPGNCYVKPSRPPSSHHDSGRSVASGQAPSMCGNDGASCNPVGGGVACCPGLNCLPMSCSCGTGTNSEQVSTEGADN